MSAQHRPWQDQPKATVVELDHKGIFLKWQKWNPMKWQFFVFLQIWGKNPVI